MLAAAIYNTTHGAGQVGAHRSALKAKLRDQGTQVESKQGVSDDGNVTADTVDDVEHRLEAEQTSRNRRDSQSRIHVPLKEQRVGQHYSHILGNNIKQTGDELAKVADEGSDELHDLRKQVIDNTKVEVRGDFLDLAKNGLDQTKDLDDHRLDGCDGHIGGLADGERAKDRVGSAQLDDELFKSGLQVLRLDAGNSLANDSLDVRERLRKTCLEGTEHLDNLGLDSSSALDESNTTDDILDGLTGHTEVDGVEHTTSDRQLDVADSLFDSVNDGTSVEQGTTTMGGALGAAEAGERTSREGEDDNNISGETHLGLVCPWPWPWSCDSREIQHAVQRR